MNIADIAAIVNAGGGGGGGDSGPFQNVNVTLIPTLSGVPLQQIVQANIGIYIYLDSYEIRGGIDYTELTSLTLAFPVPTNGLAQTQEIRVIDENETYYVWNGGDSTPTISGSASFDEDTGFLSIAGECTITFEVVED